MRSKANSLKLNPILTTYLQIRFSLKGLKSLPKFTSENLRNIGLEDRYLAGVISNIHRVLWVSVDPVDVRNDSQ